MSGGHFDYAQYKLQEIVEQIKDELNSDEYENDETFIEFRNAINTINKAYVYMQRIDWLLSGDDSEETFHDRLKNNLNEINIL